MMPVPVFLIEFRERHGRDPQPSEMSTEDRALLLECARKNEASTAWPEEVNRHLRGLVGLRPVTESS